MTLNEEKNRNITNSIAEMIYNECRPFSIVEDRGFRKLIQTLEQYYVIPSRKLFSTKYIPDLYNKNKSILIEKIRLDNPRGVCFTTDIWSSISGDSFLR